MTEVDSSRTLLHSLELSVRWGDMDAVGHVNNATYFTYFEQTRIDWYNQLGLRDEANSQDEGPVLVTTGCTYHRQLVFPARIVVSMFGGAPGRSSYPSFYEVRNAADTNILHAEATATSVWVDHNSGKSKPLPDITRSRLAGN